MVGVSEYEAFVQRIWRDVSGIEYTDERPRLRVTSTNVDFSKLSCVLMLLFNLLSENGMIEKMHLSGTRWQ